MLRLSILLLAVPLIAAAQSPASPEKTKAPAPAKKEAGPTPIAAAGMVVVKDPESGQLRAPNAQEAAALSQAGSAAAARVTATEPQRITSPVGGFPGVRLDDSTMVYSVATVGPGGKLIMQCIDGKSQAEAMVKDGSASKPVSTPVIVRKEAQLELQ